MDGPHFPEGMIDLITHHFMEQHAGKKPKKPVAGIGAFFATYQATFPEALAERCERMHVNLEALLEGDTESAMKILTLKEQPLEMLATSPQLLLAPFRAQYAALLSPEAMAAFTAVGLGDVIREANAVDIARSTTITEDCIEKVLHLLGYVKRDEWWSVSPQRGTRRTRIDYETMIQGKLHFRDFAFEQEYVRGLEFAFTVFHHKNRDAAALGAYADFNLVSIDRPIVDMPVITLEEAITRAQGLGRDPFQYAFRQGYALKHFAGGHWKIFQHPVHILNKLTQDLEDPDKLAFFYSALGLHSSGVSRPDAGKQIHRLQHKFLRWQAGQAIPEMNTEPAELRPKVYLDFEKGEVEVDCTPFQAILNSPNARRLRDVKSLGNIAHARILGAL